MFSAEDLAKIAVARKELRVTQNPYKGTLLVACTAGWMLFDLHAGLECEDCSSNIEYQESITGVACPSWHVINAIWEAAEAAHNDLVNVQVDTREPPPNRITRSIASYLAMKQRVDEWGGFERERETLPSLLADLSPEEREIVELRERGARVV